MFMKTTFVSIIAFSLGLGTALAGFSERKLEAAKKAAADQGRGIAFVFYQNYWDPRCPKCVQQVDANNSAIDKAIPRSVVKVIEINKGDKDLDKLPSTVPVQGQLPRVVVTDAACEKVIASIAGAPDREKAKEFETKVEEATGK
jgi:hypothetical protein